MQQIVKVYSGKSGRCMCGCQGKWTYTQWGADNDPPSYDVTDKVNERSVKVIANKVLKSPNLEIADNAAFVDNGNRMYAVYFAGKVA